MFEERGDSRERGRDIARRRREGFLQVFESIEGEVADDGATLEEATRVSDVHSGVHFVASQHPHADATLERERVERERVERERER